jgi:hypothetical protein
MQDSRENWQSSYNDLFNQGKYNVSTIITRDLYLRQVLVA